MQQNNKTQETKAAKEHKTENEGWKNNKKIQPVLEHRRNFYLPSLGFYLGRLNGLLVAFILRLFFLFILIWTELA